MVDAPSRSSSRAVSGFAHGSRTEVLSTRFAGRSPSARSEPSLDSTPRSATRNDRTPSATPRRASATHHSTPSLPRAMPPAVAVAADWPPASQAPRGPRKRLTSTPCSAPSRAISAISASVSIITPLPCETRRRGTSREAASSSTARITSGPSTDGISTRYRRPSAKRASLTSRSLCPERLEGGRVARQREHVGEEAVTQLEEQQLVEVEAPAVPLARCPVERGGAIVRREHVDQTGRVRAVRLLRQAAEEAEDRLTTLICAGHHALARNPPDGVLGEHPAQAEAVPARECIEQPADDVCVALASRGHVSPPNGRSAR